MKKYIIGAMLLATMPVLAMAVAAPTTYLVDGAATGTEDGLTPATAFHTIQAAVNAASAGDTISVAAGTYVENVSVTKALTLQGANTGVPGNGSRGSETVIDANNASAALLITSNNVIVDGFKIVQGGGSYSSGIWMADPSNVTIKNNIFTNNVSGIWADCGGSCVIEYNLFDGNNFGSGAVMGGISADSTTGLTIRNNEFKNEQNGNPILLQAAGANAHNNVEISGNTFHTNAYSNIYVIAVAGGTFTNNTVTPASDATGFSLSGGNSNITFTGNTITGGQRGIRIEDVGYGFGGNSNISISENNVSNNSEYGIGVTAGGYPSGTVYARLNYWGAASGPATSTNPDGTGSPVVGNEVDYSPWYTSLAKDKIDFLTTDSGTDRTATVPEAFTKSGAGATMELQSGSVLTSSTTWNGEFSFPKATTNYSLIPGDGFAATDISAIELGARTPHVTSDLAVKVTITGKASSTVGISGNSFMKITETCDSSTNPTLAAGAACRINSGSDVIIFTKTVSTLVVYTQLIAGGNTGSSSGGGSASPAPSTSTTTNSTSSPTVTVISTSTTPTNTTSNNPVITNPTSISGGQVLGATLFVFNRNLRFGLRGDDVIELHKILIKEGFLLIKEPTGYFGPLTRAALMKWQTKNGIAATGFFGPISRAFLNGSAN